MIKIIKSLLQQRVIRYIITAVIATLTDMTVFFLVFNFIAKKQDIHFTSQFALKAPTVSLMVSFCFGLTTSFTLTRYFVFTESDLKAHHQFIRFTMVALAVLALNYALMTFLITHFNWYPTIARGFSAVSIGVISFFTHKFFTFKSSGKLEEPDFY